VVVIVVLGIGGAAVALIGGGDSSKKVAPTTFAPAVTDPPTTVDTTPDTVDTTPPTADTTPDTTPVSMPNVVGDSVTDAESALSQAGWSGQPTIQYQTDPGQPGLVLSQDPADGDDVAGTVTLTVSRLPSNLFVDQLQATSGGFDTGAATVVGTTYTDNVLQDAECCDGTPNSVTFALSQHWARLKGTVGLDDAFSGQATVQVEIFDQDNNSLFKNTVKVGSAVPVDIPVAGVVQMTLTVTDLTTDADNSGNVVWGGLELTAAN
jgi:hypothetical protein